MKHIFPFQVSYCEDKEGGIYATPLQLAAICGKSAICLLLIHSGADMENPTEDGKTPLHWSAWFGHKDTSLKLINAGSKVDAKTKVILFIIPCKYYTFHRIIF